MTLQHLRSSTANKRPLPGSMSDGQIAINTNTSSPGLFFKDSAGALVKVGPVHVGSTAPNVSPAGGGETGNTVGEQWLDTSGSTYVFKVWDGSAWRSEAGEFVNASGDVMTGALGIIAGSAGSPGLYFSGDTNTGIYSPGADQVAISTNGTGRLFVGSNGQVGISQSSLATGGFTAGTLRLGHGNAQTAGILLQNNASNTDSSFWYTDGTNSFFGSNNGPLQFYVNGGERMRLDSSGRLGLGTSVPGATLEVTGSSYPNFLSNRSLSSGGSGAAGWTAARIQATTTEQMSAGFGVQQEFALRDADGVDNIVASLLVSRDGADNSGSFAIRTASAGTLGTRLHISSGGSVGIATSSPAVKLQVNEADGTDAIRILDSVGSIHQLNLTTGSIIASRSSGSNGGLTIGTANQTWGATGGFLALNTNGSTRLHITSGGAVGIGTATPQSLLDVNLGSSGVHATFGYVAGRGLELSIDAAASTGGAGVVYNAKGGGVSGTHIFQTDNNERCRLTADGKLLVGTSSARSNFSGTDTPQFQVEGTTFNTSTISVASASSLGGGNIELAGTGTATVGNTGTVSNNGYLGSIHFLGGDGTNLRKGAAIDCQVDGTPGTNDMPGRLVFSTCPDGSASPTERMRITNGGNVLIGCQSLPSATVEGFVATGTSSGNRTSSGSSTSAYNHWVFYNGNGIVGSISTSASATTYATSSDYRLKENVVPLTGAADRVKQLQVHRFNFIADPDTTVDGFLAHEAQAVVPECVTGTKDAVDADGNPVYQGIDQSKLVPLLTAALQEALAEIESLRARLDAAGI